MLLHWINYCMILITLLTFSIFGESGMNSNAMSMYTSLEPLEMVKSCLEYNHFAPCYPSYITSKKLNEDPFVMDTCPHIYFIGNQKQFETELLEGEEGQICRIVMVPKFYETSQVVLVNLKTLDTNVITLNTDLGDNMDLD